MRNGRFGPQRLLLLVGVPLIVALAGGFWWLSGGRYVSTENAYVKAHIVQISPEIAGQVRRVLVKDHQTVQAGEPLMTRMVAEQLYRSHWYDLTPARQSFGYTPIVSNDEALNRTIQWWRQREVRGMMASTSERP